MLLNFTAEERALLAEVDACIDIPRNTKPAVVRKIYDNLKKLIAQMRGLAPVLEARGFKAKKRMTKAEVRALVAQYPAGAAFEEIARWRKLGYSTDTMNALRLAELTRQVRYTGADFDQASGANSPRYQQGQSQDPQCSLREGDEDDEIDPEKADDRASHDAACQFHRNQAQYAKSMNRCAACHNAASLHAEASRLYPDRDASEAARAASRKLSLADVS